jgi:hypothetical protein
MFRPAARCNADSNDCAVVAGCNPRDGSKSNRDRDTRNVESYFVEQNALRFGFEFERGSCRSVAVLWRPADQLATELSKSIYHLARV